MKILSFTFCRFKKQNLPHLRLILFTIICQTQRRRRDKSPASMWLLFIFQGGWEEPVYFTCTWGLFPF